MSNSPFHQALETEVEARYLTSVTESQTELKDKLLLLLEDLEADFEGIRENPIEKRMELEANISSSLEYLLLIHWPTDYSSPLLLTFDVRMFTPVEPYHLERALVEPVAMHFQPPILVYNSYGRDRTIDIFPRLLDFENVIRELIITVMFKKFGPGWEAKLEGTEEAKKIHDNAIDSRNKESESKLHDYMLMHWLYYTDLKDLRTIIEHVDELTEAAIRPTMSDPSTLSRTKRLKWERELTEQLPFSSILDNYDQISIAAKISEMRELRNRVMHGRYLTESNAHLINLICDQYHRFVVKPGYVGQFKSRTLIS